MIKIKNPVISGFYPDPSICRAGENFYIVNSSFCYFPGVPIWHSSNLADWEQVGNVLDRESQIPLKGCGHSEGIFAPVIRYHGGVYYMITTNISGGGNFIVTAEDPKGPWSEPYFLGEEAAGIDPSLFFEEDGTCYYVGTRPNPAGVRYNGDWEIWVQKINLSEMKLTGESHALWKGALKDVIWPEGPHLYRKDDYYYLMIAEGGTGPNHAVTIARSKNIYGPYENNPNNPILTHRHLGKEYPVIYVGHGDLVDDTKGNWYMVMLASRRCEGYVGLGRETFLAKVYWEDGWPVVNPGVGRLEDIVELPFENREEAVKVQKLIGNRKKYDVVMLRNPGEAFYTEEKGRISIRFLPETLKERKSPAYLGFRQLEYEYEGTGAFQIEGLAPGEEFGIAILQSNEYHILFRLRSVLREEISRVVTMNGGDRDNLGNSLEKYGIIAEVVKVTGQKEFLLNALEIQSTNEDLTVVLKVRGHGQKADFILVQGEEIPLCQNADIHEMSTEEAGGFVGNTIGVYTSSNGLVSDKRLEVLDFTINYGEMSLKAE